MSTVNSSASHVHAHTHAHLHHIDTTHSGSDVASDATTSQFAATLAAMLAPANTSPTARQPDGVDSDLSKVLIPLTNSTKNSTAGGTISGTTSGTGTAATSSTTATSDPDASSTAVTSANNDINALNPSFRARLNRVIDRMQNEYGYTVDLVEGTRSQARQDFLYEQGRTRPGDVVTWTKSSKHTLGLAADLKIDGSYDNPEAYQRLAQIASQEGLHTLGARDPGHVEFPTRAGAAAWGATANANQSTTSVSRAVGMALAHGGVFDEESPSDVSSNTSQINSLLSRSGRTNTEAAMVLRANGFGGSGSNNNSGSSSSDGSGGKHSNSQIALTDDDVAPSAAPAQIADVAQVAHVAQVAQVATPGSAVTPNAGTSAAAGATGSAAADRVGHMLDVRDASPALPLSHVTLALDTASGGTDRIRIDLRGTSVHTAISLGDQVGADRMSLRVGELQQALEQHGLAAGSISVASSTPDTGAGWSQRHGNDASDQSDQQSPTNRDRDRQDAETSRQRARRASQGE